MMHCVCADVSNRLLYLHPIQSGYGTAKYVAPCQRAVHDDSGGADFTAEFLEANDHKYPIS